MAARSASSIPRSMMPPMRLDAMPAPAGRPGRARGTLRPGPRLEDGTGRAWRSRRRSARPGRCSCCAIGTRSESWHGDRGRRPAGRDRSFAPTASMRARIPLPAGRHVIRFAYPAARDFLYRSNHLSSVAIMARSGSPRCRQVRPSQEQRTGRTPEPMNPQNRRTAPDPEVRSPPFRRQSRGFTLIELMVVLAIIAIVMAIAFTEYLAACRRVATRRRRSPRCARLPPRRRSSP